KCSAFYWENEFVLNVVLAIAFARAFPVIGINLAPEYSKIVCVAVIFFFTGLGLRTRELLRALADYKFNLFVQSFNLGIVTVAVWLVSLGLAQSGMNKDLADGITICGALPMTVNMVIVLTKSAGGDEAAAVFNSALGNLMGVFVTPLWVVALLGKAAAFSFADVLAALAVRVLLPLAVGQFTQYQLPRAAAWAKTKKPQLKRLQEVLLTFVVYVVFCGTFHDGVNASAGDVAIMFVVMPALILATMALAWVSLGIAFPAQPALRVMGLFGCTHKTIAMGVPLIDAIFASQRFDSRRAFFLLPLLVWHPAQLIIGSAMTGKLSRWVTSEKERLGIIDDDAEPAP
ncbi:putative sodium bile acid cotransporter, partial [Pelagophyceae sp. CCMP2097]